MRKTFLSISLVMNILNTERQLRSIFQELIKIFVNSNNWLLKVSVMNNIDIFEINFIKLISKISILFMTDTFNNQLLLLTNILINSWNIDLSCLSVFNIFITKEIDKKVFLICIFHNKIKRQNI